MRDIIEKIKRYQPLIKARRGQLAAESTKLAKIRQIKDQALTELEKFQKMYIEGVETLNKERQTNDRSKVHSLELGVDHAKSNWYKILKQVKEIESQERAQVAQLLLAERNLKSVEKLEERYKDQLEHAQKLQEQKSIDDVAIRNYTRN